MFFSVINSDTDARQITHTCLPRSGHLWSCASHNTHLPGNVPTAQPFPNIHVNRSCFAADYFLSRQARAGRLVLLCPMFGSRSQGHSVSGPAAFLGFISYLIAACKNGSS